MANANGEGSIYKRMRNGKHTGYVGALSYADEAGKAKRHTVYGKTRREVADKMRSARTRLDAARRSKTRGARWPTGWVTGGRPHWPCLTARPRLASYTATSAVGTWSRVTSAGFSPRSTQALRHRGADPRHAQQDQAGQVRRCRSRACAVGRDDQAGVHRAAGRPRWCRPRRPAREEPGSGSETSRRSPQGGPPRQHGRRHQTPAMRRGPALPQRAECSSQEPACAEARLLPCTGPTSTWMPATLTVRGTLGRVGGKLIITEPKTDRSRRSVPLSAPLVTMLRLHRANQDAERHAARDQWQDNDLVFATEFGHAGRPAQRAEDDSDRRAEGGHGRRWRAHPAPFGSRGMARRSGPHQGRGRSARAFVDRGYRGHLRPHLRHHRTTRSRCAGRRSSASSTL